MKKDEMTTEEKLILIKCISEKITMYEKMIEYNNIHILKYPDQDRSNTIRENIRKHNAKIDKLRKILDKINK